MVTVLVLFSSAAPPGAVAPHVIVIVPVAAEDPESARQLLVGALIVPLNLDLPSGNTRAGFDGLLQPLSVPLRANTLGTAPVFVSTGFGLMTPFRIVPHVTVSSWLSYGGGPARANVALNASSDSAAAEDIQRILRIPFSPSGGRPPVPVGVRALYRACDRADKQNAYRSAGSLLLLGVINHRAVAGSRHAAAPAHRGETPEEAAPPDRTPRQRPQRRPPPAGRRGRSPA